MTCAGLRRENSFRSSQKHAAHKSPTHNREQDSKRLLGAVQAPWEAAGRRPASVENSGGATAAATPPRADASKTMPYVLEKLWQDIFLRPTQPEWVPPPH